MTDCNQGHVGSGGLVGPKKTLTHLFPSRMISAVFFIKTRRRKVRFVMLMARQHLIDDPPAQRRRWTV